MCDGVCCAAPILFMPQMQSWTAFFVVKKLLLDITPQDPRTPGQVLHSWGTDSATGKLGEFVLRRRRRLQWVFHILLVVCHMLYY